MVPCRPYGRPDVVPTEERMRYENLTYSQGTMVMVFHPGDGRSARMHFNRWSTADKSVRVCMGEAGEYGPLADDVVAGYMSVAEQSSWDA